MKPEIKDLPPDSLKKIGLKNQHSYTLVDVREVILASGELEYLVFLRNPTGNFFMKDAEVWKGDWGPRSELWDKNPKLRKQLNYEVTEKDIQKWRRKQIKEIKKFAKAKKKKKKGEEDEDSPDGQE